MKLDHCIVLAASLHAGVLLLGALTVPPLADTDSEVTSDTQHVFRHYFVSTAEPEVEDPPARTPAESVPDGRERVDSRCGDLHGGSMGEPTAADTDRRYGVQGPNDNPDPHIAREPGRDWEATTFPLLAPLQERTWGGDPDAPMMPWGRDDSLGNDEASARGHMWGDLLGRTFGSPGAGIGRRRLCPTCGDSGLGVGRVAGGTAGGGPVDTERAWSAGVSPADRRRLAGQ